MFGVMKRIRIFKRYSKVSRLLVMSFASILLIPGVMMFLFHLYSVNVVADEVCSSYQTVADHLAEEADVVLNTAVRLNYKITTGQAIQQYILSDRRDYMQEYEIRQELIDSQIGFDNIATCYFYLPQFDVIIADNNVTSTRAFFERNYAGSYDEWLRLLRGSGNRSQIVSMETGDAGDSVRYLLMRKVSVFSASEDSAVAVTEMRNSYLRDHLRFSDSRDRGMGVVFSTPYGDLAHTPPPWGAIQDAYRNGDSQFKTDGVSYRLLTAPSAAFDFQILYAVPMELIKTSSRTVWQYFLVLFGGSLAATPLLGAYLVRKNYRPVQKICSLISSSVKNDLDNEYALIEDTLQDYIVQNHTLQASCPKNALRLQQLYLEKLLLDYIPNRSSIPDGLKLHNISFPYEAFTLVLFQPDEDFVLFQDETLDNQERTELTQFIVQNIVTELYSKFCRVYMLEINEIPIALCNLSAEERVRRQLSDATDSAIDAIRRHFQLNFKPFFSSVCCRLEDLPQAYAEVRASLDREESETDSRVSRDVYAESIEHCVAIIKEHYADSNLSLTMIAETLSLNPSYISRYFKQQTGIGLLDYLQHYRVNAAKELIRSDPDILLKDIADRTGFYNSAALLRVFKQLENMTPGQYKASILHQKETPQ